MTKQFARILISTSETVARLKTQVGELRNECEGMQVKEFRMSTLILEGPTPGTDFADRESQLAAERTTPGNSSETIK
jgi:hypothetical protein